MTNTQRNTTVLSILVVIIFSTGAILVQNVKKKLSEVQAKNVHLKAEIFKYDKLINMQAKLEKDFAALRLLIAEQSKVLVQTDTPAGTFSYLLKILKWMNTNINFDFAMSKSESVGANWNEYIISGKGEYFKVADLVKQLEYQRALLSLEDVSVTTDPSAVSDTVYFSIVFRTHYTLQGTEIDAINKKNVPPFAPLYALFKPRIWEKPQETLIDPLLIDVDTALLIGITDSRVFMRDTYGIIHIMSVGDKVAYGYLYAIDKSQDKVIFRLNEYGTQEDRTIFLKKK